jgi:hypothetical protein
MSRSFSFSSLPDVGNRHHKQALYDYGICLPSIVELLQANVCCNKVLSVSYSCYLHESLLQQVKGSSVFLIGSHWHETTIQQLEEACSSLHILVPYARDCFRYPGHIQVSCLTDHEQLQTQSLIQHYPWLHHLRLLDTAEETVKVRQYYLGFLDHGRQAGYHCLEDIIAAATKTGLEFHTRGCLQQGSAIYFHYTLNAAKMVQESLVVDMQSYTARIVFGNGDPEVPLLRIAAQDVDFAVNVTFLSYGATQLVFYTENPIRVQLHFVEKAPFFGLGNPCCKRCHIPHWFCSVQKLLEFFPNTTLRVYDQ